CRKKFRALPESARLRRQHELHSNLPDPGEIRSNHHLERREEYRVCEIRGAHVASEVVVGQNGLISEIKFIRYKTDTGQRSESGSVKARVYVIAANAIETPRLLLMSKNGGRTARGVANTSDMVGRNLMDHPYYVVWGMSPEQIYPYRGPLITSGIGDLCDGPFRRERAAFRVDIGNEGWNFVVGGDPNVTTLDFV